MILSTSGWDRGVMMDFIPSAEPCPSSNHGHTTIGALLSLHKPDTDQSDISGLGMCERFIESFRIKSLASESPQIIGSEPAGRPQHPKRLIISLVLISLFTSVQTLASFRQIYQGNNHNFPPVFNPHSGLPIVKIPVH